ncbi:ATP-binding protein, partial [Rhizobium ruizarguesonis]
MANVDQGISELVKNSYDADAEVCWVKLDNKPGGTLVLSDDGIGMTRDDIDLGWLVLGRSGKQSKTPTPKFNRVPVGDKGLGRLSALRLGRKAVVRSRPAAEPGTEYAVTLDWTAYDLATTVEEVRLQIDTLQSDQPSGTEISIEDLKRPLTRIELERLARTLILLSDPFQETQGFRTELEVPGFEDLTNKVKKSYFGDAEYHLRATLDSSGQASFELLDWKDEVLAQAQGRPRPSTVPAIFDLWIYLLDKKSFSTRSSTIAEVREWLSIVGGVHVFEGPIRVPPYGERGVDWLEMNLRRAQNPEERPSTNTTLGKVVVDNSSGRLEQKTDRV